MNAFIFSYDLDVFPLFTFKIMNVNVNDFKFKVVISYNPLIAQQVTATYTYKY